MKGTRKLVERYGERLVCVRYLYDAKASRQYKTVEVIVSSAPWQPKPRSLRRRDGDVVAVRIAYGEVELRARQAARRGMASGAETLGDRLGRCEALGDCGAPGFPLIGAARKASARGNLLAEASFYRCLLSSTNASFWHPSHAG